MNDWRADIFNPFNDDIYSFDNNTVDPEYTVPKETTQLEFLYASALGSDASKSGGVMLVSGGITTYALCYLTYGGNA